MRTQCFCCFHYCILPKILIIVADFAQFKALTVVLEICAHFFLFPIVLFFTKALEVSCLRFTEREDCSKTSVKDSIKIFIERENIVSTFLV